MEDYGELRVPPKLVRMVKAIYEGNQCAVVDGAGQTGWFDVKSGVKQGCNMSGFLFLLVLDWIMRKTLEGDNTGIRWKLWTKLNDLDNADDIALISSTKQQVQQKEEVRNLSANSKATGLKINSEKTKLLRLNTTNNKKVQVDDRDIDDIAESFGYLGAHISSSGGTEDDIKARLGKARAAYSKLEKNSQFTTKNKIKIFRSNVISVLLYGCENWGMTQTDEKKLDAFLDKSLRLY